MSIFGAGFALVSELIPHRSHFGARLAATGLSVDNRLINWTGFAQLIYGVPSWLVLGTHADTLASLVARFDGSEAETLIGFLVELVSLLAGAYSFSE
jgi:hypothetical protein